MADKLLTILLATPIILGKMLITLGVVLGALVALFTVFWVDYKLKGGKRSWWAYIKHAFNNKW